MTGLTKTNLLDLAQEINSEHEQCQAAMRSSLHHAVKAGELLLQAKGLVKHGEWLPWIEANCSFSERTARAYMRVAANWPELKTAATADLTLAGALKLLTEPSSPPTFDDWVKANEIAMQAVNSELAELDQRLERADTMPELAQIARDAAILANACAAYRLQIEREAGKLLNALGNFPDYEIHELGNIYPMMTENELVNLAESIKQNGLIQPITLYEGKILDGKNRYEACKIAGILPAFSNFPDDYPAYKGDAMSFVLSANEHRAQFTESQRAVIGLELGAHL